MKVKFMKKMVAVLCAATMSTVCVTSSVGAVKVNSELQESCSSQQDKQRENELKERLVKQRREEKDRKN